MTATECWMVRLEDGKANSCWSEAEALDMAKMVRDIGNECTVEHWILDGGWQMASNAIKEGTRVRLIDPPGSKVPYGTEGVAEEAPGSGGLFWVQFPQGRMHTRVSEVEIVQGV